MAVAEATPTDLDILARKERSPLQESIRRLLHHRVAVASMCFLALVVAVYVFADNSLFAFLTGKPPQPLIAPYRYDGANFVAVNVPPGSRAVSTKGEDLFFLLGTDYLGRDVLSRTLYGTRVSLSVAIAAATVSMLVGLVYGTISGYVGGRTDNIMMRIVDFLYGFPFLIMVILLQTYFKALARQGSSSSTPILTLLVGAAGLAVYFGGASGLTRELDSRHASLVQQLFWAQIGLGVLHLVLGYFAGESLPQVVYTSLLVLIGLAHLGLLALFVYHGIVQKHAARSSRTLFFVGEGLFVVALLLLGVRINVVGGILAVNKKMGGMLLLFIAIGLINWIGMSRLARGQVLSYKQKEFVEAAHSVGASDIRIIGRHLVPNIIGPLIVQETLAIPGYIFTEAFLSFIGLGVDSPTPSWGIMISECYPAIRTYPWQTVAPAAALTLTTLAFNFLGDGLRDALDPRLKE
jgi:ABC-type dipeptide/oligopeptide/nickel transport system permease subunit